MQNTNIKSYDIHNISYKFFYEEHIVKNKPCIIQNFANIKSCNYSDIVNFITETEKKKYDIGKLYAYDVRYKNICNNNIVNGLENDASNIFLIENIRTWIHDKDVFTNWHWDGNGADVLNISIRGSKEFHLSPPGSILTYPLSSGGVVCFHKPYMRVTLLPGDMLYIPAYWFHKVLTLEDNTINTNYQFFNLHPTHMSYRSMMIFKLHNLLSTNMCNDEYNNMICTISNKYSHINYIFAIAFGMIELLPIALVYVVAIVLFKSIVVQIVFLILTLLLLFLPYLQKISFGLTKLYGFILFIYILIIHFTTKS